MRKIRAPMATANLYFIFLNFSICISVARECQKYDRENQKFRRKNTKIFMFGRMPLQNSKFLFLSSVAGFCFSDFNYKRFSSVICCRRGQLSRASEYTRSFDARWTTKDTTVWPGNQQTTTTTKRDILFAITGVWIDKDAWAKPERVKIRNS